MKKSKRKMSNIEKKYMVVGFMFLLPAIVTYLIFAVIPFFDSFVLSFQEWGGFGPRTFIGINNYVQAFRDRTFVLAIRNSVYLGVVSAFFSVLIGVFMAWLLLYVGRKWGGFFRTILFSPSMIPAIITAFIFAFVFEPEIGVLNNVLGVLGLKSLQHAWLTNKATALNCILFVSAWKQIGRQLSPECIVRAGGLPGEAHHH